MTTVMEDGRNVLNCARSTLWVVDEEKNEMWSTIASGQSGVLRIPLDKPSIAGWVAQNKETANIASVKDDARWFGRAAEADATEKRRRACSGRDRPVVSRLAMGGGKCGRPPVLQGE
mmetsp:Transcript_2257/g.6310  ORF Transcript_2257/g.6310 Transcript_2257/m.6310 type:complete len:117 (-) Transcript_2257:40-390(-)